MLWFHFKDKICDFPRTACISAALICVMMTWWCCHVWLMSGFRLTSCLTSSWCAAVVSGHSSSSQSVPPSPPGPSGCSAPPASLNPAPPSAAPQPSHGAPPPHSAHTNTHQHTVITTLCTQHTVTTTLCTHTPTHTNTVRTTLCTITVRYKILFAYFSHVQLSWLMTVIGPDPHFLTVFSKASHTI